MVLQLYTYFKDTLLLGSLSSIKSFGVTTTLAFGAFHSSLKNVVKSEPITRKIAFKLFTAGLNLLRSIALIEVLVTLANLRCD